MKRYLVIAHQTAASPELLEELRQIASEGESAFTLLVPATPASYLLVYEEGEEAVIARRHAEDARDRMTREGLNVEDIVVGDGSPLFALQDEMNLRGERYDGIVVSTLPQRVSQWFKLDLHSQAAKQYDLPVRSVVATPTSAPVNR